MFYKEIKELAAHRLLSLLKKRCRIYTNIAGQDVYSPSYLWTNMKDLHKKTKFYNIDTLRDAALDLKQNDEIDLLNNNNNIYDIQLGIIEKGLKNYKEWTHIWNFIKSWKIIVLTISSLLIAIATITGYIKILWGMLP